MKGERFMQPAPRSAGGRDDGKNEEAIVRGMSANPRAWSKCQGSREGSLPATPTRDELAPEPESKKVINERRDLRSQKTALQHLVKSRGRILQLSPKCRPEHVGVGIKDPWRMSKVDVTAVDRSKTKSRGTPIRT